mgnify:FL=1
MVKRSASSKSKRRKRPKSYKKIRSDQFLDKYVTEQYKEYKRKESENNIVKAKIYKEIGIPPLPLSDKPSVNADDRRNAKTQDATS